MIPIKGTPPKLLEPKAECPFAARCPVAIAECLTLEPPLVPISEDESRRVACIRSEEISQGRINGEPMYPIPDFAPDKFEGIPFTSVGSPWRSRASTRSFR